MTMQRNSLVIVFTATHIQSGTVYVGSARESLEATWAQLLAQADESARGDFFSRLRLEGADGFTLEEWAYAEDGKELRELLREAQLELGAQLIKAAPVKAAKPSSAPSNSVAATRELMALDDNPVDDDELFAETARRGGDEKAPAEEAAEKEEIIDAPVAKSALRPKSPEPMRKTDSTRDASEMKAVMAGIELRRRAMKKKPTATKSKPSATSAGAATGASSSGAAVPAAKPAKGRTGSASKEKRIKEAIAQEKAERDAQAKASVSAQADEMAALLARLDSRTKVAAKIKRRR